MASSIVEIAAAHEQVAILLDEPLRGLSARDRARAEQWQLKVECAVGAGGEWESISFRSRKSGCSQAASPRRALIEELRAPLSACKRRA